MTATNRSDRTQKGTYERVATCGLLRQGGSGTGPAARRNDRDIWLAHLVNQLIWSWFGTRHMQQTADRWRRAGQRIEAAWLARMGPAHFAHVNFRGTFRFGIARYAESLLDRPPKERPEGRRDLPACAVEQGIARRNGRGESTLGPRATADFLQGRKGAREVARLSTLDLILVPGPDWSSYRPDDSRRSAGGDISRRRCRTYSGESSPLPPRRPAAVCASALFQLPGAARQDASPESAKHLGRWLVLVRCLHLGDDVFNSHGSIKRRNGLVVPIWKDDVLEVIGF